MKYQTREFRVTQMPTPIVDDVDEEECTQSIIPTWHVNFHRFYPRQCRSMFCASKRVAHETYIDVYRVTLCPMEKQSLIPYAEDYRGPNVFV